MSLIDIVSVECDECPYTAQGTYTSREGAVRLLSRWYINPIKGYCACPDCATKIAGSSRLINNVDSKLFSSVEWDEAAREIAVVWRKKGNRTVYIGCTPAEWLRLRAAIFDPADSAGKALRAIIKDKMYRDG